MDDFVVYLVSNGSMDLYPDNTLSSFTNHLSEPLELGENWKVCLSVISIPSDVKNVTTNRFISDRYNKEGNNIYRDIFDLQPGIYPTVDDLLLTLKNSLVQK